MADGSDQPVELWCPACLQPVGDTPVCAACGLGGHDGRDASRLRIVVARLHQVTTSRRELPLRSAIDQFS